MHLFEEIINDNKSGSGTILNHVQAKLIDLGNQKQDIGKEFLLSSLKKVRRQFPQFGLLFHFASTLYQHFKDHKIIAGDELTGFVKQYIGKWKDSRDIASRNMINRIDFSGKSVLVHSNSSAIHNLFGHLAEKKVFPVVWQTCSSPVGEGLIQAKMISEMGVETHLIHEDALSNFMPEMDMAVLGADLILDDRFLNKVGSYPIALLFKTFKKPLYVLTEKRKIINFAGLTPELINKLSVEKEKPETELDPDKTSGITVHNLYFEFTPLSLVKNVFLD